MKENNQIDDLFKSKLRDHKASPDAHLKEAFLLKVASQKQRKVIPIWYYASAAAILVALGFFVFTSNQSQADTVASFKSTSTIDNSVKKVEAAATESEKEYKAIKATPLAIAKNTNVIEKETKIQKAEPSSNNQKKSSNKGITKPADTPAQPSKNTVILDEVIPDELTLAYLESEKKEKRKNESENLRNTDLFQKDIGETVVIIATDPVQEETIYLPELSQDSNMTLAQATEMAVEKQEKERSFIAKVFTELKHLKHGEKVDVNTLASNISASDGFIGNEAEEFKDRWNWIKNRVSKK